MVMSVTWPALSRPSHVLLSLWGAEVYRASVVLWHCGRLLLWSKPKAGVFDRNRCQEHRCKTVVCAQDHAFGDLHEVQCMYQSHGEDRAQPRM